jgi:hypothetical protein
MQTNATTNANKCHNKCKQMQRSASQMHQTYVELNAATYVCMYIYIFYFWGPNPSRVVLLDKNRLYIQKNEKYCDVIFFDAIWKWPE